MTWAFHLREIQNVIQSWYSLSDLWPCTVWVLPVVCRSGCWCLETSALQPRLTSVPPPHSSPAHQHNIKKHPLLHVRPIQANRQLSPLCPSCYPECTATCRADLVRHWKVQSSTASLLDLTPSDAEAQSQCKEPTKQFQTTSHILHIQVKYSKDFSVWPTGGDKVQHIKLKSMFLFLTCSRHPHLWRALTVNITVSVV